MNSRSLSPRTLREFVRADLVRAQHTIKRGGNEIDPLFRIASPEGDWWIAITLSSDPENRLRELALVGRFMAWKLSPAFTMASELSEPDAVFSVGVSHSECHGIISVIEREPLRFLPEQWLEPEQIDPAITRLLPRGEISLDSSAIAEIEEWFGAEGRFPAFRFVDE